MNRTEVIDQFAAVVGSDHVLHQPEDLCVYECDAETLDVARPDLVILPGSTAEVQEVMRLASLHGYPVSPRGAGTGLSGGSTTVNGGISLVLTRMKRIFAIDSLNRTARVEVGATNVSVSQAAGPWGLYFAPDPSSQIASTIGGNIAENAGGPHCLKYGMTVEHVLSLKAVLYDGRLVEFGGGSTRYNPDLDLLGLMVGSEGTLAVVTEAVLKLTARPRAVETMLAYFPTIEKCGEAVSNIVAAGVIPAAMEMIDRLTLNAVEDYLHLGLNREAEALLIVELDGPEAGIKVQRQLVETCLKEHELSEVSWAENEEERLNIWKARKRSFGALGRIAPHGYVLDGVIPRSKLAQSISSIASIGKKYDLLIANVYHAGDGNLHPCLLYHKDRPDEVRRVIEAAREVLKLCVDLGGTLSGEHGIGIEKLHEMPLVFSEEDLRMQEAVKEVFDPGFRLNPSKVLPTPRVCGESGDRSMLRHRALTDDRC